jgi:hypothetical protein
MKRTLRILLIVLVVLVVAGFAARAYLRSSRVAAQVATTLQSLYGGPVQVGTAEIGLRGSSVGGLQLFEADTAARSPWLTAASVDTDISLWDVVRGHAVPHRVTVGGAAVTLRFDKDGHLLTRLPTPGARDSDTSEEVPEIELRDGQLKLQQEGRPDLVVRAADVRLRPEGKRLVLTGLADEAAWGRCELRGGFDRDANKVDLILQTEQPVRVTQPMLSALPFIPASVWEEVQLDGVTPARLSLHYDVANRSVSYRVDLAPHGTRVSVPVVRLQATNASGEVVVEDNLVRLRKVQGEAFDGKLRTEANLDFRRQDARLAFDSVVAEGLNVARLPEAWKLPPRITGRLFGKARLQMTLARDGIKTEGQGHGEIRNARIAGLPTDGPIVLDLRAGDGRFEFVTRDEAQTGQAGPGGGFEVRHFGLLPVALVVAAPQPPARPEWLWPARAADAAGTGLELLFREVTSLGAAAVGGIPHKLEAKKARKSSAPPRAVEVNFKMKKVDLAQFAQGLGLKLPFPVAGRLTFAVKAAIPLESVKDLTAYRVHGTAELEHFRLADLELEQLNARVAFTEGVLRLEDLSGRLAPGAARAKVSPGAGTLHGSARLQLAPLGKLTAQVDVKELPLERLASLAPQLAGRLQGPVSATAAAEAPADRLQAVDAWSAKGRLTAGQVRVMGTPVESLASEVRLHKGQLALSDVRLRLFGGTLTGSAEMPLRDFAGSRVDLRFQKVDVGALMKSMPAVPVRVEGKATGSLSGRLQATKAGKPQHLGVVLKLEPPGLRVQGIPTDSLEGKISYQDGQLNYSLTGRSLGGTFDVDGQIPLAAPAGQQLKAPAVIPAVARQEQPEPALRVRLRGASLSRLWTALGVEQALQSVRGRVDLEFTAQRQAPTGVLEGSGEFLLRRLRWGQFEPDDDIRGNLILRGQQLQVRDVTAAVGDGELRFQAVVNFDRPLRGRYTLSLQRIELSRLLAPWPDAAARVQGAVEARLRGTLGTDMHGSGEVILGRGKVFDVEVNEWHLPLRWSFTAGRGQLDVTDSTAQVALGRTKLQAGLVWGASLRLQSQLQFYGVDMRTLVRQVSGLEFGSGPMAGRIALGGSDIRSLNDLTGTLQATLGSTQAMQLPVLQQVSQFLGIGSSVSFTGGRLEARLARGIVTIQEFSLPGKAVQLFVEGTVSLLGRLNLDVTVNSGRLTPNLPGLQLLGLRIPVTGAVPVSLLLEASTFLSNRLIRLQVTGTVRSPTIRLLPLPLLTQGVVQFFLHRANLPLPVQSFLP